MHRPPPSTRRDRSWSPAVPPPPCAPAGGVLAAGGPATRGRLLARPVVVEYGVRHLLLTSRRGPAAPGAAELQAELTAVGAHATIAGCDAADRDALAALLAAI